MVWLLQKPLFMVMCQARCLEVRSDGKPVLAPCTGKLNQLWSKEPVAAQEVTTLAGGGGQQQQQQPCFALVNKMSGMALKSDWAPGRSPVQRALLPQELLNQSLLWRDYVRPAFRCVSRPNSAVEPAAAAADGGAGVFSGDSAVVAWPWSDDGDTTWKIVRV